MRSVPCWGRCRVGACLGPSARSSRRGPCSKGVAVTICHKAQIPRVSGRRSSSDAGIDHHSVRYTSLLCSAKKPTAITAPQNVDLRSHCATTAKGISAARSDEILQRQHVSVTARYYVRRATALQRDDVAADRFGRSGTLQCHARPASHTILQRGEWQLKACHARSQPRLDGVEHGALL